MHAHATRAVALAFLIAALLAVLLASRFLSLRSSRPVAVWGAGGYLALLHGIAIFGLATGTRFDTALAQMTLCTFPFSMSLFDTNRMQGFATPHDLAVNYVRYILYFGGLNAMLFAGFLVIVVPSRRR